MKFLNFDEAVEIAAKAYAQLNFSLNFKLEYDEVKTVLETMSGIERTDFMAYVSGYVGAFEEFRVSESARRAMMSRVVRMFGERICDADGVGCLGIYEYRGIPFSVYENAAMFINTEVAAD